LPSLLEMVPERRVYIYIYYTLIFGCSFHGLRWQFSLTPGLVWNLGGFLC
jgi:hypothetical protein